MTKGDSKKQKFYGGAGAFADLAPTRRLWSTPQDRLTTYSIVYLD